MWSRILCVYVFVTLHSEPNGIKKKTKLKQKSNKNKE